jgi:lysophospholipase L1-like esterase
MFRILALGDSYTIGEGVAVRDRWPVQFARLLRAAGVETAEPTIVARTGWTTAELLAGIERADLDATFDLVTLQVGVNNQYRGLDVVEYRRELRELLDRAAIFAGGRPERVTVLSIPDWSVTPFAAGRDRKRIAREIDDFNAAAREEAEQRCATFVDVTPSSRQAAGDASLLAADGLHPSAKLYALWAKLVATGGSPVDPFFLSPTGGPPVATE